MLRVSIGSIWTRRVPLHNHASTHEVYANDRSGVVFVRDLNSRDHGSTCCAMLRIGARHPRARHVKRAHAKGRCWHQNQCDATRGLLHEHASPRECEHERPIGRGARARSCLAGLAYCAVHGGHVLRTCGVHALRATSAAAEWPSASTATRLVRARALSRRQYQA